MAKNICANGFYESAGHFYKQAQGLEDTLGDTNENQVKINATWGIATHNFWLAFVLGHLQAPYSLSVCFNQGLGIKPNDYVAKLLFGVALELEDVKCQRETNKQEVPTHMNKAVKELAKLVRETNSKISSDTEIGMDVVNSQMEIFDNFIALPDGNTMADFFSGDIPLSGVSQASDSNEGCCVML